MLGFNMHSTAQHSTAQHSTAQHNVTRRGTTSRSLYFIPTIFSLFNSISYKGAYMR
ncbi:MAG: hypothetical protein LBU73_03905 [Helicobacteraceae bacterium]|nr:hypothetical protein [Helicobacteraceae bacterium]